jgi:hypothetical protein
MNDGSVRNRIRIPAKKVGVVEVKLMHTLKVKVGKPVFRFITTGISSTEIDSTMKNAKNSTKICINHECGTDRTVGNLRYSLKVKYLPYQ